MTNTNPHLEAAMLAWIRAGSQGCPPSFTARKGCTCRLLDCRQGTGCRK